MNLKIVKWFGVWNSAHISCICSVHGMISPSYYQGQKASNSFSLQTNNVPFLWFLYFKLPFVPCATFIWKNVDDIWGFLVRCGCSWRETRSSTTLPPSSTSARQVRPREKSALSNSRKYRTQTHQHWATLCVYLSVCIYLCALWSSQTPATRPRRAHNTNSLNLRMTRSNSSRGGSLLEDVMTQHFSPWSCAPFNIKQSGWDSSSCGVTLSFRMTSGNSTPPATVYLPLSWKDTRSQK